MTLLSPMTEIRGHLLPQLVSYPKVGAQQAPFPADVGCLNTVIGHCEGLKYLDQLQRIRNIGWYIPFLILDIICAFFFSPSLIITSEICNLQFFFSNINDEGYQFPLGTLYLHPPNFSIGSVPMNIQFKMFSSFHYFSLTIFYLVRNVFLTFQAYKPLAPAFL